jgi:hypothetical protein
MDIINHVFLTLTINYKLKFIKMNYMFKTNVYNIIYNGIFSELYVFFNFEIKDALNHENNL